MAHLLLQPVSSRLARVEFQQLLSTCCPLVINSFHASFIINTLHLSDMVPLIIREHVPASVMCTLLDSDFFPDVCESVTAETFL